MNRWKIIAFFLFLTCLAYFSISRIMQKQSLLRQQELQFSNIKNEAEYASKVVKRAQSKMITEWRKKIDSLKTSKMEVYNISVLNQCTDTTYIAIHYKALDGLWVTEGWWPIGNKLKNLPLSTVDNEIYFHVTDNSWLNQGELKELQVSPDDFFHLEKFDLYSDEKRKVSFMGYNLEQGPLKVRCN